MYTRYKFLSKKRNNTKKTPSRLGNRSSDRVVGFLNGKPKNAHNTIHGLVLPSYSATALKAQKIELIRTPQALRWIVIWTRSI